VERLSSTLARWAQLYKDIKEATDRFFNRIGAPNIVDRTWRDVERSNIGLIRTRDTKGKNVAFKKAPKASKSTKDKKPANTQNKVKETETTTTMQLLKIVRDAMGPTAASNTLALTTLESTLGIPLSPSPYNPPPCLRSPPQTTNALSTLTPLSTKIRRWARQGSLETMTSG
jgi:hypothetical protein